MYNVFIEALGNLFQNDDCVFWEKGKDMQEAIKQPRANNNNF